MVLRDSGESYWDRPCQAASLVIVMRQMEDGTMLRVFLSDSELLRRVDAHLAANPDIAPCVSNSVISSFVLGANFY